MLTAKMHSWSCLFARFHMKCHDMGGGEREAHTCMAGPWHQASALRRAAAQCRNVVRCWRDKIATNESPQLSSEYFGTPPFQLSNTVLYSAMAFNLTSILSFLYQARSKYSCPTQKIKCMLGLTFHHFPFLNII